MENFVKQGEQSFGITLVGVDKGRIIIRFSLSDGVLIMTDVSNVQFFVDGETSFLIETFKLATFCFQ